MSQQGNRRRADRIPYKQPGQWSAGKLRDRGVVVDISEEGLALHTSLPPGLTRPVKVFVPLPERQTGIPRLHMLTGVVVWRTRRRCGVAFSDLARKTCMALKGLHGVAPASA